MRQRASDKKTERRAANKIKLSKSEKNKIKKALLSAAVDGNVQAAKLLLSCVSEEEELLESLSDEELWAEKERLLKDLKEIKDEGTEDV